MTARMSRSMAYSSYMENSRSRMGSVSISVSVGRSTHPIQFRQFPLRPERQNAGRAQEVSSCHQCNEQKFFIYLPLSVVYPC